MKIFCCPGLFYCLEGGKYLHYFFSHSETLEEFEKEAEKNNLIQQLTGWQLHWQKRLSFQLMKEVPVLTYLYL
jgi:hypothetical protein